MQKMTTKLGSQVRQNSMRAKDLDIRKANSTITKDSKEGSADKHLRTVDSKDSRKSLLKRESTVTQSRLKNLGTSEQAEIIRRERQKIEEQERKDQEELKLAQKRISISIDSNSDKELIKTKPSSKTSAKPIEETLAKVIEYKKPEMPVKPE